MKTKKIPLTAKNLIWELNLHEMVDAINVYSYLMGMVENIKLQSREKDGVIRERYEAAARDLSSLTPDIAKYMLIKKFEKVKSRGDSAIKEFMSQCIFLRSITPETMESRMTFFRSFNSSDKSSRELLSALESGYADYLKDKGLA